MTFFFFFPTSFLPQVPCHSGHSLDRVEADPSVRQTIETLVELARESSDMIVWALTELLDRLAKVGKG